MTDDLRCMNLELPKCEMSCDLGRKINEWCLMFNVVMDEIVGRNV